MVTWLRARWVLAPRRVRYSVLGLAGLVLAAVVPLWAWLVFPALFLLVMLAGMASAAVEIWRERRAAATCWCTEGYVCTGCDAGAAAAYASFKRQAL